MDIDHTVAYRRDRAGRPDGPGQTSLDNAGPMTRHHHRIKTSGPVRVRQPLPGTYIWRTLNDRYRITNNTGTPQPDPRSEERRVGKECVSTCRSSRSPSH